MSAIAAVLALSSTALIAQAAPEATQPVTQAPATPVPESVPVAPTASEPSAATVSDSLAPSAEPAKAATAKSTKSTTTRRTASVARPAKAAPPVARATVAAPVAAPAPSSVGSDEAALGPAVAVPAAPPAEPVAAMPPARDASAASNIMLPIAGGLGLALLTLIVIGVAMRRRRRRDEEFAAETYEPAVDEAPAEADPLFAAQASAPLVAAPAVAATVAETEPVGPCADAAPGSHVEAACEGPTEDNPSLSIKKRLKRAQFFDQREQLVAAGMAVPVASDAGLPDAVEVPEPAEATREPA